MTNAFNFLSFPLKVMKVSPMNNNFSLVIPLAIFFKLLRVGHFIFFQVSALIIVKPDPVFI